MKILTLVVDERELSTIRAALLLLQEQADALPEDLAEMLREHGRPLMEAEVEQLVRRLAWRKDGPPHPRTDTALPPRHRPAGERHPGRIIAAE